MSTETIFRQLGRLHESYTRLGPGKTREEYLKLFSRTSYSTQNEWPYSSPFAGFYDVTNTTTSLILLNQRFKWSHLRGHVLPKESPRPSNDDDTEPYHLDLTELEQKKSKRSHKLLSPRVAIDPERHFESQTKYWHYRMCKSALPIDNIDNSVSALANMPRRFHRPQTPDPSRAKREASASVRRRSHSAMRYDKNNIKTILESQSDPAFSESLWQYYLYVMNNIKRPKVGLQHWRLNEPPSRLLRKSGVYRNPALTHGQQLYLLEKSHVYDMEDSKERHMNSYLQVLSKRFAADLPSYKLGLNDPRDFSKYSSFVRTPRPTARPVNTGYLTSPHPHRPRIPGERKQLNPLNDRAKTSLDAKHFSTSMYADRQVVMRTPQPSRRLSISSLPKANGQKRHSTNHVNVVLNQEPKHKPLIPVLPSQS